MNLMEVEAGRGNCDYDAVGELRELRAHFEVSHITKFLHDKFLCWLFS
jgi:hypothetical protein